VFSLAVVLNEKIFANRCKILIEIFIFSNKKVVVLGKCYLLVEIISHKKETQSKLWNHYHLQKLNI